MKVELQKRFVNILFNQKILNLFQPEYSSCIIYKECWKVYETRKLQTVDKPKQYVNRQK